jgi:hypothetical protein
MPLLVPDDDDATSWIRLPFLSSKYSKLAQDEHDSSPAIENPKRRLNISWECSDQCSNEAIDPGLADCLIYVNYRFGVLLPNRPSAAPKQSLKRALQQNLQDPVYCPGRALTLEASLSSEVAFTEKPRRVIVEPCVVMCYENWNVSYYFFQQP